MSLTTNIVQDQISDVRHRSPSRSRRLYSNDEAAQNADLPHQDVREGLAALLPPVTYSTSEMDLQRDFEMLVTGGLS